MKTLKFIFLLFFITVSVVTGCATARKPIFLSDTINMQSIDEIYILPVLDLRFDKTKELNLNTWVHNIVNNQLKKKKYNYQIITDESSMHGLTEEILTEETSMWYRDIKPDKARWVMLLVLHDSTSKMTFGSTGNAEMSGRLYDKENGEVVWRDKAIGQMGQGGLIGMMMKGLMEKGAIETATLNLMNSFPVKQ